MIRFDPKDPLIQQNKKKIKKLLDDPNIVVYFVASSYLKEVISKAKHPLIQGITPWIKFHILQGSGIVIQKRIIWEMINGNLDKKNTFVFSNGDIRVTWQKDLSNTATDVGWSDNSLLKDMLKLGDN